MSNHTIFKNDYHDDIIALLSNVQTFSKHKILLRFTSVLTYRFYTRIHVAFDVVTIRLKTNVFFKKDVSIVFLSSNSICVFIEY